MCVCVCVRVCAVPGHLSHHPAGEVMTFQSGSLAGPHHAFFFFFLLSKPPVSGILLCLVLVYVTRVPPVRTGSPCSVLHPEPLVLP